MANNLAKGRLPVEQGIWKNAELATNGNHTNYSDKGGWAVAELPAFYTLDLGELIEISQIRILLFDGLGHTTVANSRKYTFDLNVSLDGKKFHQVYGGRSEHEGNGWFIVDLIDRPKIRFVQFHCTANTANKGIHLVEFAVYDVPPPGLPGSSNQKQFSVQGAVPEQQTAIPAKSKIFISHCRENKVIGEALVELLIFLGVDADNVVFTSNPIYGIPTGDNIFDWLKGKITEKPHIIFLLSPEYYRSVACLSEMGAAWIVGSEYTTIFSFDFDLNSRAFQSGPLDPRRIGFRIDDKDRLFEFAENMIKSFGANRKSALVNQRISSFLKSVEQATPASISDGEKLVAHIPAEVRIEDAPTKVTETIVGLNLVKKDTASSAVEKFLGLLENSKVKDVEVLLLHYIIDQGRFRLGIGWQEEREIKNIKAWEEVNHLKNVLSTNYENAVSMYGIRKLTEVSELSGYGKPMEVKLVDDFVEVVLDPSPQLEEIIAEVVGRNSSEEKLPF